MVDFDALSAPFPTDAISWRAGSIMRNGEKALAFAYVDARDVMNRLDEVCGPAGWQCKYSHANGKTVCDLGISCELATGRTVGVESVNFGSGSLYDKHAVIENQWVWKADGAGDSDIEAEKGALSDAFKRAAVRWGIGRYLYNMEAVWVPCQSEKVGDRYKWIKWLKDPWDCIEAKTPRKPSVFQHPRIRSNLHKEILNKLNTAISSDAVKEIMLEHKTELDAMKASENQDDKGTELDIRNRANTLYTNFKQLEK